MADELLNSVIQLENQLQLQLHQERERAAEWLDGLRGEQDRRAAAARNELEAEKERTLAIEKQRAEQKAQELIDTEQNYCRRLDGLSDQVLSATLRRNLVKILPGQGDDHQDVQS